MMKDYVVAPAIEEPAPGTDAPKCGVCHVSLREVADNFKSMKHSGSALKKRKLHPPKKYRDVSAQNAWLLSNVYDVRGNYIFCQECIRYYLGVGKQRLSRLPCVKVTSQMPTVPMTKGEVSTKKLESRVIMPG